MFLEQKADGERPKMNDPQRILEQARRILSVPDVWVNRGPIRGEQCLETAIGTAACLLNLRGKFGYAYDAVMRAIRARCPGYPLYVHNWNDEHGRTLEQVISLIDEAMLMACDDYECPAWGESPTPQEFIAADRKWLKTQPPKFIMKPMFTDTVYPSGYAESVIAGFVEMKAKQDTRAGDLMFA